MKGSCLTYTLENLEHVASSFLEMTKGRKKFSFYGSMGAGKTTFITALCKRLNAIDSASSPTFSIVNEYDTQFEDSIYHFDFYRINNSEELFDIGFEDYCRDDNWCFIEWPEKAEEIIPQDFIHVQISVIDDLQREIHFTI